jgi:hypothetical protein
VDAILAVAMVALARKAIAVNVKDYQAGAIGLAQVAQRSPRALRGWHAPSLLKAAKHLKLR